MLLILFLLFSVIAASGCTGGGAVVGGPGIAIESFEADITNPFIGEVVTLTEKIRNTATRDTGNVLIQLIGLPEGMTSSVAPSCEFPKLLGANPLYGTSGESQICNLAVTFPEGIVQQGLSTPILLTARLYYSTETEIIKTFTVVPQTELRAIENRGGTLPAETVTSTGGPISLNIKSTGPIRIFQESSGNGVELPIEIEITNVGGGTPYSQFDNQDTWNTIRIEASGTGIQADDCNKESVSLFKGQSTSVVCIIHIQDIENSIGPSQRSLSVKAAYGYFVDTSVTVTVHYRETA
jgi:hypothetical protein